MKSTKWTILESSTVFESGYIKLRKDKCQLPDGRTMPGYYVFEFPDWVNVVAVTVEGEIVLVEQYRHASQAVHLELPGGALDWVATPDSGSQLEQEDPKRGALRELVEETGYVPDDIRLLQVFSPNPALQNNKQWVYVATGCRKVESTQLDPFEDIRVRTVPVAKVFQLLKEGQITHSLMVASLYAAQDFLGITVSK